MKNKLGQNFYSKFIVKTTSVFVLFSIMLLSSSFKKSNPLRCNNFFEVKSYVNSLTLEYSSTSFKAGTFGFSDAKVSLPGGIFSWQRISSNEGDLSINRRTGRIDKQNSDPGEYIIVYKVNNETATVKIVVLNK